MTGWIDNPAHHRWLEAEGDRLLDFARASRHPAGGFAWLGVDGTPDLDRPVELGLPGDVEPGETAARMTRAPAEVEQAVTFRLEPAGVRR